MKLKIILFLAEIYTFQLLKKLVNWLKIVGPRRMLGKGSLVQSSDQPQRCISPHGLMLLMQVLGTLLVQIGLDKHFIITQNKCKKYLIS